jgi:hypothetical protein
MYHTSSPWRGRLMSLPEEVVVLLDLDEDNLLLGSKGGVVTKEERLHGAKD